MQSLRVKTLRHTIASSLIEGPKLTKQPNLESGSGPTNKGRRRHVLFGAQFEGART